MYERFEELLKERGIKTSDVAKATGISQQTFSAWKRRNGELTPSNLKKVADYFGVSMDFFSWSKPVEYVLFKDEIKEPIIIETKEKKTIPMYAEGACYELPEEIYEFVIKAIENYKK